MREDCWPSSRSSCARWRGASRARRRPRRRSGRRLRATSSARSSATSTRRSRSTATASASTSPGAPANADANPALRNMFGLPDAQLRWIDRPAAGDAHGRRDRRDQESRGQAARAPDAGHRARSRCIVLVRDVDAAFARVKQMGAPVVTTGGVPVTSARRGKARASSSRIRTATSSSWCSPIRCRRDDGAGYAERHRRPRAADRRGRREGDAAVPGRARHARAR